MAVKTKPRDRRVLPVAVEPPPKEFTISASLIKWAIGAVAGLLTAIVTWFAVWDRIDTHWRLETIQAAQDKKIEADIKSAREKADADTKRLAQRAEVGRSWLFYAVVDGKALTASYMLEMCKAMKRPEEVCSRFAKDETKFTQQAEQARSAAAEAGKEK